MSSDSIQLLRLDLADHRPNESDLPSQIRQDIGDESKLCALWGTSDEEAGRVVVMEADSGPLQLTFAT